MDNGSIALNAVTTLGNRWDRIAWTCTIAGLALLALAVGREWDAARDAMPSAFANPRIAITDTGDAALSSAIARRD